MEIFKNTVKLPHRANKIKLYNIHKVLFIFICINIVNMGVKIRKTIPLLRKQNPNVFN